MSGGTWQAPSVSGHFQLLGRVASLHNDLPQISCKIPRNMRPKRANRFMANLMVQQEVFERALVSLLNGIKHVDKNYLDTLKGINSDKAVARKKEEQYLQKSLFAVVMVIQKLKHSIRDRHLLGDQDIDGMRKQLSTIEEKLTIFKTLLNEQMQVLLHEEEDFQQSIDVLQQRLNESIAKSTQSEQSFSTTQTRAKSQLETQLSDNVHPNVQEFQIFLKNNGGHTGGWDAKDHSLFIRFLQKYRGSDQMTAALLNLMPDKTPDEISKHEEWYHEYLSLKEAQRRALKEWRQQQTTAKQEKCEMSKSDAPSTASPGPQYAAKVSGQRNPSVKEKIRRWKEEQEKLKQQQHDELLHKKWEEKESWRKKVAYMEQQRKLLSERREECSKSKLAEQNVGKKEIPNRHIPLKEFWEQDKLFILRRQTRLQRFSSSPSTQRNPQPTGNAERDPARLLRHTAVWKAKIKRSSSIDCGQSATQPQSLLFIANVPHLAIPKWREGLI